MISRFLQVGRDKADVGGVDPRLCRRDGSVEVLDDVPASSEPNGSSLQQPSARHHLEAPGTLAAIDDFEREGADRLESLDGAIAVLDAGGMDNEPGHQAQGIGKGMALAGDNRPARAEAPGSVAFSGLHDWLSMMPVGERSRPRGGLAHSHGE